MSKFLCIGGLNHGETVDDDTHASLTIVTRDYKPFGQRVLDEDGSIAIAVGMGKMDDPNIVRHYNVYRRERLRHSDMSLTTIYVWEGPKVTKGDKDECKESIQGRRTKDS